MLIGDFFSSFQCSFLIASTAIRKKRLANKDTLKSTFELYLNIDDIQILSMQSVVLDYVCTDADEFYHPQ